MKTQCPSCKVEFDCESQDAGLAVDCPECNVKFTIVPLAPKLKKTSNLQQKNISDTSTKRQHQARIKRQGSTAMGCFLPVVGIALLIVGVLLILTIIIPIICIPLGLFLIFYGDANSRWYVCGDCGTRLSSKRVTVCPACKAKLLYKRSFKDWIFILFGLFIVLFLAVMFAQLSSKMNDDKTFTKEQGTDSEAQIDENSDTEKITVDVSQ